MRSATPETGSTVEYARAERQGLPFWTGTPARLLRFPGVLAAVVGASLILAVATAAGPLFLSSAGVAALTESLAGANRSPALQVVGFGPVSAAFLDPPDQALRGAAREIPELASPLLSVTTNVTAVGAGPNAAGVPVRLTPRACG